MAEVEQKVQLYVYDLSHGAARMYAQQFLGIPLEGIWHSSVVVYGKEFYFGEGGINEYNPGTTHHGRPLRVHDLGSTHIPEAVFREFVDDLRTRYGEQHYHLLDNNCNSFTNEVAEFLTGKGIPDYIRTLPALFESTAMGQALRPMIDQMFRTGLLGFNTAALQQQIAAGGPQELGNLLDDLTRNNNQSR
eukprot:comp21827_c0_seq1/m.31116 comp21827_c0_seq1/g.31116  ORF comp21827_c0_seq1/g.31116 comp21827_c0_seq1/m.31116 type:complete len:190 (-) comp21827_c0_seq1:365-934(-)